ncbi:MAG: hypothetical protein DRH20_13810 [Deltaproteobacteria bacterium]|nr:MAG: hypothetical protein DRH20_13810 [Deltaproteobacteria bacterium]
MRVKIRAMIFSNWPVIIEVAEFLVKFFAFCLPPGRGLLDGKTRVTPVGAPPPNPSTFNHLVVVADKITMGCGSGSHTRLGRPPALSLERW